MITIEELLQSIRLTESGIEIRVHVQPGAKRTAVIGMHADRIKVAVKGQAIAGAANEDLRNFLAELLGARKADVSILRGEKSRQKTLRILGVGRILVERIQAVFETLDV